MGTIYIGRYKVIEEIGRGGMGIVYRGEDPALERIVAIKVLPPKKLSQKQALQRFLREARVSARLDHPHVIKIFDIGEEEGIYHIVMEYVPGKTLRELIETRASIDLGEMSRFLSQICSALEYAHAQKIVHRDIKPENIMISESGQAKIMDFGLACLEDRHSLTDAGMVMGTIAYFSPEQARGEMVDHRSDIYSLGVMLFEMLTGRLPFEATNPSEMIQKHLSATPLSPRMYNRQIPGYLETITLKTLMKRPDDRYQNVSEITLELEKAEKASSPASSTTPAEAPGKPEKKGRLSLSIDGIRMSPPPEPEVPSSPMADERVGHILDKLKKDKVIMSQIKEGEDSMVAPPQVLVCLKCGFENDGSRKYCSECGGLLTPSYFVVTREAAAHNEMGVRYFQEGKTDEAVQEFLQAVSRDPDLVESHLNLGRIHLEREQLEEARQEFLEVVRIEPLNPEPHRYLAEIFRRQDLKEQAIAEYIRALKLFPADVMIRCQLGFLYFQTGQLPRAVDEYRAVLARDPSNIEAHLQLGFIYASQSRTDEAIEAFEWVVTYDPRNEQAYQWLGNLHSQKNNYSQAEKSYQKALGLKPDDPATHAHLGTLYEKHNRKEQALRELQQALDLDPGNLEARQRLADVYIKARQPDRAIQELEEVLKFHPQSSTAHRQLGELYLGKNQLDQALLHFERTVNLEPASADTHNKLGRLYLKKDYSELSIQEYQAAVSLDPANPAYHEDLGMAYYLKQNYNQAIAEIKKAATLDSPNMDYHKALGVMYEETGRVDEAIKEYQKLLEKDPDDSLTHGLMGKAYAQQGLLNMAIYEYQKALELNPLSNLMYIYMGQAYSQAGKADLAIEAFRKAIDRSPGGNGPEGRSVQGKAYRDLGMVYFEAGENEKSLEILRTAEKLIPDDARTLHFLGRVFLRKNEFEKARHSLTRALTIEPQNAAVLVDMSLLFERIGEIPLALKAAEKALVLQPNRPEHYALMGRLMSKYNRIEDAVNLMERAIGMATPGSEDPYRHQLGLIFALQKIWDRAAIEFQKALELNEEQWVYHRDLARVLRESGERKEAQSHFERAMELVGDEAPARQIREELRRL